MRRSHLTPFNAFLSRHIEPQRPVIAVASELVIDTIVSPSGADLMLVSDLERAGPYGSANPEPMFLMPDMLVVYAGTVGTNHVRLRLVGRDGAGIGAIAFRAASTPLGENLLKSRSARIHVAGKLKRDDYEGTPTAQLHIEDAAPAEG